MKAHLHPVGVGVVLFALVQLGGGTAHASGLSDFDAPMLGSTASAQWSRLPGSSVIVEDGADTYDVFLGPDNGASSYAAMGPGAWGVLASSPYFSKKVSRFFSSGPEFTTTTIIELTNGAPTSDVVRDLARQDFSGTNVKPGKVIVTSSKEADGWTVWTTKSSPAKDYPKESVHSAYASKGREIIRVYCGGDLSDRDGECEWAPSLALHIARTKPAVKFPQDTLALVPKRAASGLTPEFASYLLSEDQWVTIMEAPRSMSQFLGENTLALQWSVPKQKALTVSASITSLPDQAGLDEFLADLCRPTQPCRAVKDLAKAPAGGQSAGVAVWPEGEKGDWGFEFQAGDDTRVMDVLCTIGDGYERALTKAEAAACRSAIQSVAGAVFAK